MRTSRLFKTLLLISAASLAGLSLHAAELSGRKVVIDPGHGGSDPGAVGIDGGAFPNEEDFVLDVSHRFRTRLQSAGATVVMTRTTDTAVSLTARRDLANSQNPDCFISIHCNSFSSSSANGTETFWWTSGNSADQNIATKVQNRLLQFLGRVNRGVKQANFTVITGNPPSCLGELLFISNQTEFNIINTELGKNNSADAFLYAVLDFVGVTRPSSPSGLTANAVSASQINLNWTDNSGIETSYKVERATSASGPWTQVATLGAGATSYSSTGLSGGLTYYYRVRAFNSTMGDSLFSNTANATTQVSGGPSITTQPVNRTVNPGTTVNFSVVATGNPTLTYQWRRNGSNLSNGGKFSGVTTTNLTISNVQQTEVGNYDVVVANSISSVTSATASLAVNAIVAFNETFESGNLNNWVIFPGASALTISTAQNHTGGGANSALVDSSVDRMYRNMGVQVAGRGRVTVWIYDDSQARAFAEVRSYSGTGFDDGTLDQLLAIGKYNTVTLPGETYDGTKYQGRITFGASAGWFNLNAPGAPSRSPGWHKFELERLANSSTVNWYVDGVLARTFTGLTSPAWDSVVIGSVGTGSPVAGNAWLDDIKIEYFDPPNVVTQPTNKTVVAGNVATFTVVGGGTITGYQWRKNGVNLSNGGKISGATTNVLSISNAQDPDAATYDVVISNGAGPVISAGALLKVAPAIVTPPVAQTKNAGQTAEFTVVAAGQEPLEYQWKRNGAPIEDDGNVTGANTETLTLIGVSQTNAASYSVTVTNAAGSVTSSAASLTVIDPPVITMHPANESVVAGATVTFVVEATGTGPLSYQWQFDEDEIPGATGASYTVTNAQTANAGSYGVRVGNSAGSAFSTPAILTVNNAPVLAAITNRTAIPGVALTVTNSATDTDDPPQVLTFSLDPGAPAAADIDPLSGVFTWTPGFADMGTTNVITVRVTDDGVPALDDVEWFTVIVIAQPVIQSVTVAGNDVTIVWSAVAGKTYRVHYKNSLADPGWIDLVPDVVAAGETASAMDTLNGGQRFYRVMEVE